MKKVKEYFNSPKRIILSIIGILVLCGIIFFAANVILNQMLIGKKEAKNIALADAGISSDDISIIRVELGFDHGSFEYEVEFYLEGNEYEYTIDGKTGEIISKDTDYQESVKVPSKNQQTQTKETGSSSLEADSKETFDLSSQSEGMVSDSQEKFISEEEAKQIALKDAGTDSNNISNMSIKKESDDGVWEYEIEFYVGNTEYDYEIDAASGAIRDKDIEIEDDFYHHPAQGNYISEADAKALALARVSGAAENNIHIHLDYDDGRAVYEGSIHYQGIEYEFEIDAVTGTFLDWDIDD